MLTVPPGKVARTHAPEECNHNDCPECVFFRRAPRWQRSWLSSKIVKGRFYMGCDICKDLLALREATEGDMPQWVVSHQGFRQFAKHTVRKM